jgi:hypothetical protein
MVIENPERFGLSQLHQLRGRVGRGSRQSHCILITPKSEGKDLKRLKFLSDNSDGFKIAQYDLENRGPGDFFGTRQHGLPTLKIASFMSDMRVLEAAKKDGYELLIDGNNASDDADDRPGMKAVLELNVRSPLRECGITKAEVRKLSKSAGLFTWDKPAYACLATRIPTGEIITAEKLTATENAESTLADLGFTDFRIRMVGKNAKIQVREEQLNKLLLHRTEILEKLKPYYASVTLDLEVRS